MENDYWTEFNNFIIWVKRVLSNTLKSISQQLPSTKPNSSDQGHLKRFLDIRRKKIPKTILRMILILVSNDSNHKLNCSLLWGELGELHMADFFLWYDPLPLCCLPHQDDPPHWQDIWLPSYSPASHTNPARWKCVISLCSPDPVSWQTVRDSH